AVARPTNGPHPAMSETHIAQRRMQMGYATLQAVEELDGRGCVHARLLHRTTASGSCPYDGTPVSSRTPPQVWQVQGVKRRPRGPANGLKDRIRERFRSHCHRVHALGAVVQTEQWQTKSVGSKHHAFGIDGFPSHGQPYPTV